MPISLVHRQDPERLRQAPIADEGVASQGTLIWRHLCRRIANPGQHVLLVRFRVPGLWWALEAQYDARPVWALHRDLKLAAGGFDVPGEGIDAARAQIAVLHLRNAVLSDTDGCRERGLGIASVFAQLAKTVLRNLAIHLLLDRVDAGTVARTTTSNTTERGHRFFPFLVFGLAAVAAPVCFIVWWCSVNRRSAMGMFVAYHFVQFHALSPATSMIARDWMSKAKSTRMWAPPWWGEVGVPPCSGAPILRGCPRMAGA